MDASVVSRDCPGLSREAGILQTLLGGSSCVFPRDRGATRLAAGNGGERFLGFVGAGSAVRASGIRQTISVQRRHVIVESLRGYQTVFGGHRFMGEPD